VPAVTIPIKNLFAFLKSSGSNLNSSTKYPSLIRAYFVIAIARLTEADTGRNGISVSIPTFILLWS
jgi:hypothetical protein